MKTVTKKNGVVKYCGEITNSSEFFIDFTDGSSYIIDASKSFERG